jgi:hypothetical protein
MELSTLEMDMVDFVLRSALGPVSGNIGEEPVVDIGAWLPTQRYSVSDDTLYNLLDTIILLPS